MLASLLFTRMAKSAFSTLVVVSVVFAHTARAQDRQPASEPGEAGPAVTAPATTQVSAPGHRHGLFGDSQFRSPGLAIALSLTPMPVDFGNLYAENLGWGIAYTAVEVSLVAPMMWLVGGHMDHGRDDTRRWSDGERNTMIALGIAYIVVKLAAGVHAGYAAGDFNDREAGVPHATMVLLRDGAAGGVRTWL